VTTHTKTFQLRRLPSPRSAPEIWKHYLEECWPTVPEWAREPFTPLPELRALLERDMPESLPDYDALAGVMAHWGPAGLQALANWNMVPFFEWCSVTRSLASGHPTMLRNYDLGLEDTRGIFCLETLPDGNWMLGGAEAGWGFLDGVNSRGLAATMTFGGRFTHGTGWSIPLLLRHILANYGTADEASAFLERVPHRLVQNFMFVDKEGGSNVVYAAGDRDVIVEHGAAACTNHQREVHLPRHAQFTRSVERLDYLRQAGDTLTLADMLRPPLYCTDYENHFGTVYSVEHDPVEGTARYAWPGAELRLTPESPETELKVHF
jgi:predicted choloylglycine hydrolase